MKTLQRLAVGSVCLAVAVALAGCYITVPPPGETRVVERTVTTTTDSGYQAADTRLETYYYYPDVEVYFNPANRYYFWYTDGDWHYGLMLPGWIRVSSDPVELRLLAGKPYYRHDEICRRYGYKKTTYYYYPHSEVYYNPTVGVWFWSRNGSWFSGFSLPGYIRIREHMYVDVSLRYCRPYYRHTTVLRRYPPAGVVYRPRPEPPRVPPPPAYVPPPPPGIELGPPGFDPDKDRGGRRIRAEHTPLDPDKDRSGSGSVRVRPRDDGASDRDRDDGVVVHPGFDPDKGRTRVRIPDSRDDSPPRLPSRLPTVRPTVPPGRPDIDSGKERPTLRIDPDRNRILAPRSRFDDAARDSGKRRIGGPATIPSPPNAETDERSERIVEPSRIRGRVRVPESSRGKTRDSVDKSTNKPRVVVPNQSRNVPPSVLQPSSPGVVAPGTIRSSPSGQQYTPRTPGVPDVAPGKVR